MKKKVEIGKLKQGQTFKKVKSGALCMIDDTGDYFVLTGKNKGRLDFIYDYDELVIPVKVKITVQK